MAFETSLDLRNLFEASISLCLVSRFVKWIGILEFV